MGLWYLWLWLTCKILFKYTIAYNYELSLDGLRGFMKNKFTFNLKYTGSFLRGFQRSSIFYLWFSWACCSSTKPDIKKNALNFIESKLSKLNVLFYAKWLYLVSFGHNIGFSDRALWFLKYKLDRVGRVPLRNTAVAALRLEILTFWIKQLS